MLVSCPPLRMHVTLHARASDHFIEHSVEEHAGHPSEEDGGGLDRADADEQEEAEGHEEEAHHPVDGEGDGEVGELELVEVVGDAGHEEGGD